MKRAAAYARVSSNKQSETSIETQFEVIENFAKQNDLKIVDRFYDKITASGTKKRPEFSKMIENAFAGKYDFILVFKYDRFFRDNVEEQKLLRDLEKINVFVLSCLEKIDTSTPSGRLQRWMISGLNRFYIENLQQEINMKSTKVAEKAYFMGGIPPYGFKVIEVRDKEASRNRKIYAIDENEAPTLLKIFEMFAAGKSYAEIAQTLNKSGIKTRRGKNWTRATLYDIIRNEKYSGDFVWRKGNHDNGRLKREDMVRVPNALPRIVPASIYKKVLERLEKSHRVWRTNYTKPLLRGILYCGDCGALMIPDGVKSNRYVCSRWKNKRDVPYMGISIDKADNYVLSYIENVLLKDVDYEEIARGFNEEQALQDEEYKKRLEMMETRKEELEQKIHNAIQAVLDGSPLADELQREAAKMRKELEELRNEIQKLKSSGPVYISVEQVREKMEEYRKKLHSNRELKRELIRELIKKATLYKGGFINIETF